MDQNFKLNFDEMGNDNSPPGSEVNSENDNLYSSSGQARNLCFVWPDGSMKFLNYAYLVTCELNEHEQSIKMVFTSSIVQLKGLRLFTLFNQLFYQTRKAVICTDERYNKIHDEMTPIVNEMRIDPT